MKRILISFAFGLLAHICFGQSVSIDTSISGYIRITEGNNVRFIQRGQCRASNMNGSVFIYNDFNAEISWKFSNYLFTLGATTPTTADSLTREINRRYCVTGAGSRPTTVTPSGSTYTRFDTIYTSTGSPHTITSGKSSVLMIFGNGYQGSINGLTMPANSTSWSDVIDQPGAVLPAITLTVTSDTVRVFTKIRQ